MMHGAGQNNSVVCNLLLFPDIRNVQVSYGKLGGLFAVAGLLHPEQPPVGNQLTRAETQHLQPRQVEGDGANA